MSERDPGTAMPEEKPKGMTKFKRRISRILGRDDAKRATQGGPPAATPVADKPTSSTEPTTPQPALPKAPESTSIPTQVSLAKPTPAPPRPQPALTAAEHAKLQEQKVRALFAKYNVTLEIGEWTSPFKSDAPRVEKKVRMRVRRTCHRCRTQFGVDQVCTHCNHTACRKCPRYPTKKVEQPKPKEGTAAVKSEREFVKKPASQRTRMICHKCQTPFKSKNKKCGSCQHERCAQCTRSAPKGDTTNAGGAAPPLPRSFIKWTCHECGNVHRDPENPCLKCGHSKCDQCANEKVQRANPKPGSGDKMEEVEERMKTLGVSSQAAAT